MRRIQLFSERCSGSNYFESLIRLNLPDIHFTNEHGFKHWLPTKNIRPEKSDTLIILLTRSPYKWLPSLYARPWHVDPKIRNLPFEQFISTEWRCIWSEEADVNKDDPRYGTEMLHERIDGRPFANVLEMRSIKHKRWLALAEKTPHFATIRFEDVIIDPKQTIERLSSLIAVSLKGSLKLPKTYKGKPISLKRRALKLGSLGLLGNKQMQKHPPISPTALEFISKNLDWEVEHSLGYSETKVAKDLE